MAIVHLREIVASIESDKVRIAIAKFEYTETIKQLRPSVESFVVAGQFEGLSRKLSLERNERTQIDGNGKQLISCQLIPISWSTSRMTFDTTSG